MSESMVHHTDALSEIYAKAILEIAEENDQLNETTEQLQQIGQLINDQPQLLTLLSSRLISWQERSAIIEKIFNGKVSDLLLRFLQVINNKNRLDVLPNMVVAYTKLLDERSGVTEAEIDVATDLSQAQVQQIAQSLGRAMGRNIVLHQHVDPNLIGGLRVRVGDRLIDGSVVTQLRLMRNVFIEAGRRKVRAELTSLIED